MTGRQYTFKRVGSAFAVLGYIVKWYNQYHQGLDPEHQVPDAQKETKYHYLGYECPVCKWSQHFLKNNL